MVVVWNIYKGLRVWFKDGGLQTLKNAIHH